MDKKKSFYNVAERNGVLDCCSQLDRLAKRLANRHRDRGTREFLTGISALMAAIEDAYRRDLPISVVSSTQCELPSYELSEDAYSVIE
jgi:hypothetical protein